jgi:hypothetical protein
VLFGLALCCQAGFAIVRPVKLLCHRTANEDVPENTLESLHFAALMGCNVVEVDVRRTLDGQLVLQHDGYLERLSDSAGEVEERYYGDLRLLDAGGWMGDRFSGMPCVRRDASMWHSILISKTKRWGKMCFTWRRRRGCFGTSNWEVRLTTCESCSLQRLAMMMCGCSLA